MAVNYLPLRQFSRERLESLKADQQHWSEDRVRDSEQWPQSLPPFSPKLKREEGEAPRLLAEVKRASPTLGELSLQSPTHLMDQFLKLGADAISVLTDEIHFKGHPDHLEACHRHQPEIPLLFKDFVSTPYQIYCARAVGASSVLLMLQLLEDSHVEDLIGLSEEVGLEPFLEVHRESELERALQLSASIIGINARDFNDDRLALDLSTAPKLLKQFESSIPSSTVIVAQSGIQNMDDALRLEEESPQGRPDAFQIGSSLSQSGGDWWRTFSSRFSG